MHLMLSLNLFEFLPKAKADEIYVLLKEIYFALKFDKSGPLKGLTTELINACSNITIFSTSNLTYTEFYNTGCTGEGDKRLSMLIEADKNTTNNTQLLMNCTLDIIQKINDSCDFDNLAYGALIAFASLAGFVCVLWCGYSIYSALKPKTDELQQDPSIELTQPHSPIKTEPTINHPEEKNIPLNLNKSPEEQSLTPAVDKPHQENNLPTFTTDNDTPQNTPKSISFIETTHPSQSHLTTFSFITNPYSQSPKSSVVNLHTEGPIDNKHSGTDLPSIENDKEVRSHLTSRFP